MLSIELFAFREKLWHDWVNINIFAYVLITRCTQKNHQTTFDAHSLWSIIHNDRRGSHKSFLVRALWAMAKSNKYSLIAGEWHAYEWCPRSKRRKYDADKLQWLWSPDWLWSRWESTLLDIRRDARSPARKDQCIWECRDRKLQSRSNQPQSRPQRIWWTWKYYLSKYLCRLNPHPASLSALNAHSWS